jgi:hypothetical protein
VTGHAMHCEYHADAQTHAQKFAWFSRYGGSPASCLAAPARFPRPARDADLLDLTEAALSAWQPVWTRRSTAAPWVRGKIIGNSHMRPDDERGAPHGVIHPLMSLVWTGKIQGAICIFSVLFARERCRSWWARGAPLVPRAGGGPRCSGLGRRRANGARRWRRFALVRRAGARLNARPAHASASFVAVPPGAHHRAGEDHRGASGDH